MQGAEWDSLVQMLRQFTLRNWGEEPDAIQLELRHQGPVRLPMPIRTASRVSLPVVDHEPVGEPLEEEDEESPFSSDESLWAAGPIPKEEDDCARFYWPGLGEFRFSPKQAAVIKTLFEAFLDGSPDVAQRRLLDAAESDSSRVLDLFRRSRAWGRLIIGGKRQGTFRLTPLPE